MTKFLQFHHTYNLFETTCDMSMGFTGLSDKAPNSFNISLSNLFHKKSCIMIHPTRYLYYSSSHWELNFLRLKKSIRVGIMPKLPFVALPEFQRPELNPLRL